MRQEHIIPYETTIDVSAFSVLDSDSDDSPLGGIVTIIIIVGIIAILYKKGRLPMISKRSE